MCSIIGSFDVDTLTELRSQNINRGAITHSLATFMFDSTQISIGVLQRSSEPINFKSVVLRPDMYAVGHSQAPTSQSSNIHPAEYKGTYLWHNGIWKNTTDVWDTQKICEMIYEHRWEQLSEIDGSFACVYWDGSKLFVFRNEIAPLFLSENLDISSTPFEGSYSLAPNVIFEIDLFHRNLDPIAEFTTKDNPYDF